MNENILLNIFVLSELIMLVFGQTGNSTTSLSDSEPWWGPIEAKSTYNTEIRPYKIKFTKEMITDLKERINNRRAVTPPLEGTGFEYGFNTNVLDEWMDYWAKGYNFKKREKYLNRFPQYITNVQGLDIHFIWVKPKVPRDILVVPLLLMHGWPGSVREFYETIPILTSACARKGFAVEVIVPSLPGFGFSSGAVRPGLSHIEIATVFRNLMHRLGFKQFYAQGGDFGALIAQNIATLYPEDLLGYHSNLAISFSPASFVLWFFGSFGSAIQNLVVDPALADRLYPITNNLKFLIETSGFLHAQATKPDTLGVAMSDSPTGLLAHILQSFSTGSRRSYLTRSDGGLHELFTREELIDNLMFYWATNSYTTAIRIYAETFNMNTVQRGLFAVPTEVPVWTIHSKDELVYHSPAMLKFKFPNLLNSTVLDDYGHFLAMEAPKLFADNVMTAIAAFRKFHDAKNNVKCEL